MIYRIGHIILALLIFISSTGFVLNMHYCQDELKSMAIYFEAEACHQEKEMASCPMHNAENHHGEKESKGCCDDETEYLKSETDQIATASEVEINVNPVLLSALLVALQIELPSIDTQSLQYFNYKPPLIVCDLPVRLQTFLC